MELTKLFNMQEKLDERIVTDKNLKGRDLLPERVLALKVELAECANEWRGFKFWSSNKQVKSQSALLEEYVDALHFVLSIGIDIGFAKTYEYKKVKTHPSTTRTFNYVYKLIDLIDAGESHTYYSLLNGFLALGIDRLGFTWKQIEQAYFDKNKINHVRQDTGY